MRTECTPGPENPPQNGPFDLVGDGLQVGCCAFPADRVVLTPKDLIRPPSTLGKDFQDKALAGTKELLGDTEAKAGLKAGLEEQLDLLAGKAADAEAKAGLAPLVLTHSAQGNPDADKVAIGGELAPLRPVLFYREDGRLP